MKASRGMFLWMLLTPSVAVLAPSATAGQAAVVKDAEPAAASLDDAKALTAKGRLNQALTELNALAKVEPEAAGVERLRGVILYQKEQLPEAEAAFAQAVAQDAEDRESMEMQG